MPPTFDYTAPTSDAVFNASRLKWQKLGVTSSTDLDEALMQSIAYVTTVTGRYFSDWPVPTSFDGPLPINTSPELVPMLRQVVRMRVEQIIEQEQPGYISTVTDDSLLSMSVGSYSETRRDPTRRGEEKILNLWTSLNDLLWTLMTPDRYDYWLSYTSGIHAPAFQVEEVNWGLIGKDAVFFGGVTGDPYAPWSMFS